MTTPKQFISVTTLCTQYGVEDSFIASLNQMGLIKIEIVEQSECIHLDRIGHLEKIVRLHRDLNVNIEGIDVVLNLLEKEKELRRELITLKNRLRLYEND